MNVNADPIASSIARTYVRQASSAGAAAVSAYGAAARQAGGRPRTDSVALSSTTQEALRMRQVAADQPEVRADRVAALKRAVASGAYQIDNAALAARLVG